MHVFIKAAKAISAAVNVIVQVAIVAIMLLTVTDVLLRLIFKSPIIGVTEYSQMLMSIVLLSTAYAGMEDAHIKVDILMNHASEKVQKIVACFTSLLSIGISGLIGSRAYVDAMRAFNEHQTYTTLGLVKWPFFLLYAIALTVLCIAAAALIFRNIIELSEMKKGGGSDE